MRMKRSSTTRRPGSGPRSPATSVRWWLSIPGNGCTTPYGTTSRDPSALLHNRYVFNPFWQHHNGIGGYEDWEERFRASERRFARALRARNTVEVLSLVFDRLYVLRNQLVHGGATWNSRVNRDQVRDGAAILAFLMPVFVDVMMDNPGEDWGRPFYPVVQ